MPLTPGHRIGNYEIEGSLGAGGMGEVYRGRDTRLDRVVAIKALPSGVAKDPERLGRFEREARLLASVNHANIASIYGIEDPGPDDPDGPYLVLEFVDGENLAQRLARGAMSVHETLEVCIQIAAAIDAAHEQGIVHRDLKPGNVMINTARAVKVLDFGLAKGDDSLESAPEMSATPTAVVPATADGLILGTAPYMSPEQARGKPVDKRTDVWAFGCILMECLSGRATFAGDTISDVIASILQSEPDWSRLPGGVPPRLQALIRRCLTKELHDRPRDIRDLGRELKAVQQELSNPSKPASSSRFEATPSLAVLYFENLAQDPESEYFCAGITEDILTDLSKIKGLRVASRNAVARYRGAPADIPKVAEDLGVSAVLEGSVRRAGTRVRITTQLIDAKDGFQLWAERFDRTLEDVFAVQDEIAAAIVGALRVAMTASDVERIVEDRPKDANAYDLYLKGRAEYGKYEEASMRAALDLFEQAIRVDPRYALAWAGIADCHGQLLARNWVDREASEQPGLEAARKAIALNPRLPEGHKAESLMLRSLGDIKGSREALIRALQADPQHLPALGNLAVSMFELADLAGAERLLRRGIEIDSREPFVRVFLILILGVTGRHEEALEQASQMLKLSDHALYVTHSYAYRGLLFVLQNDLVQADRMVRDGLEQGASRDELQGVQALIDAIQGRTSEARSAAREVLESKLALVVGGLAAAMAAVKIQDLDLGVAVVSKGVYKGLTRVCMRLLPGLHPLADCESLAPRRTDLTLIWPVQAPMMDEASHVLFKEVRVESGRPKGSDILAGLSLK